MELVRQNGRIEKKEMLRRHELAKSGTRIKPFMKFMAIAATLLILVVMMVYLFFPKSSPTGEQLFATYYELYRDPVMTRGELSTDSIRTIAHAAYRNRDFQEAVKWFGSIQAPHDTDQFYQGISALESGDTGLAISLLEKVSSGTSDYREQALWYLGLLFLKTEQPEKAKFIFSQINTQKSYKMQEADQILKKLR
jgi:hypothetical protein